MAQVFKPTTDSAANTLTTKGDVLTYSTVIARLGVGSDAQVLTADSSQATGIKWAAVAAVNQAVAAKTVAYTTVATDNVLKFDTSGTSNASYAVTLHTAVGNTGQTLTFIHTVGTGVLSINTTSSQTVGGFASGVVKLAAINDAIIVVSDGTNWQIVNAWINPAFRANSSSTTVSGSAAVVVYSSVNEDLFGGYSAGVYTCKQAGLYAFDAGILVGGTIGLDNYVALELYQSNTTTYQRTIVRAGGIETNLAASISGIVRLTVADTIRVRCDTSVTSPTITSSATFNYFSAVWVGN